MSQTATRAAQRRVARRTVRDADNNAQVTGSVTHGDARSGG